MRIQRSKWMPWLLAILILGTVLRLVWIYNVNTQPISDFKHYHDLALSVLQRGTYELPEGLDYIKADTPYIKTGEHYPTAFRPPGYPLFLAAIYAVWPNILAAKLANVAMSILWMLAMFALGKKYASERTGLWAAFLTAIFPAAISYTSVLSAEIISVSLVMSILSVHAYKPGPLWLRSILLGLAAGFLALVKPYYIALPALYFLLVWWQAGNARFVYDWRLGVKKGLLGMCALILGMVIIISPWTIRNIHVLHRFVPISTNGSFVLYINNNDLATGKYMDAMKVPGSIFKTDQVVDANGNYNESDAMKLAGVEAKKWMMSHPVETVILGFKRLTLSYTQVGSEVWEWTMSKAHVRIGANTTALVVQAHRLSGLVAVGAGLLYALLMLWRFLWRKPIQELDGIILLFTMFYTAVIFASEGQPRYTYTLYPFLLLSIVCLSMKLNQATTLPDNPHD
ncbi:MAG: glycosyltransferase family 39 protein [Gorillibacterium sp.]|nr:glycosyltransferase family 39 protein [Gorillibacterium sp.]